MHTGKFNERDFGFFEGKRWDVIAAFYKQCLVAKGDRFLRTIINPPKGETWENLQKRVEEGIEEVLDKIDKRKNILIVGHLDVNRALLRYFRNLTKEHMFELWQSVGCINEIQYYKGEFKIKKINYKLKNSKRIGR